MLDLEGKKKKTAVKLSTSRHSRFGTTVALKAVSREAWRSPPPLVTNFFSSASQGKQQYIMHKQSTLHVGAEQTMDKVKRSKAKKIRQDVSETSPLRFLLTR